MGKIAFVFAGQGAQYSGMGQSLCEISPAARAVFDVADKLRPGTSQQCFTAPVEELSITENTQPCLYCVDLAAAKALEEAGVRADVAAGFSLGEIAALSFAGVFTPEQGFDFVCKRGRAMQAAGEANPGAMAAVLKLSNEQVEALCAGFEKVWPVRRGEIPDRGLLPEGGGGRRPGQDAGGQRRVPLSLYGERQPGPGPRAGGDGAGPL